MNTFDLDLEKIAMNGQGVANFYWPVERDRIYLVRTQLLDLLADLYAKPIELDNALLCSLRCYSKYFVNDVLRIFELSYLCKKAKSDQVNFSIPHHFYMLRAIYNNEIPRCDIFRKLIKGPARGLNVPQLYKALFKHMQWNGWNGLLPTANEPFLCLDPSQLAIEYARNNKIKLKYTHLTEWFTAGDMTIFDSQEHLKYAFYEEKIITIIKNIFFMAEHVLDSNNEIYFRQWLRDCMNFRSFYRSKIKSYQHVPKKMITGTASNLWKSILFEIVRENGGKIIACDHGYGDAHHEQLATPLVEYQHCDLFVTYNKTVADLRASQLQEKYLFGKPKPEIVSVNIEHTNQFADDKIRKVYIENKISRVLYVPTIYRGDRANFFGFLSELSYIDFQLRLFDFLASRKIYVLHKPHPEGATQPPHNLATHFGFKTIHKKFEKLNEKFDAYIIDFISSTTTAYILKSNLPVIFINIDAPKVLSAAESLLKDRVMVVDTWLDDNQRLQVNWSQLDDALNKTQHCFNMKFPDIFYQDM